MMFYIPKVDLNYFKSYVSKKGMPKIEIKKVHLSELFIMVDDRGQCSFSTIQDGPIYTYFNGDKYRYFRSLITKSPEYTESQLLSLYSSIKEKGHIDKLIVIKETANWMKIILDGQHRASILYHLFGNIELEVAILHEV